ncbi:MAG: PilZ domain-containing protein [Candidatus Eremiobacteraeota bacterium]|nr:PilZ domain-containing protein [Candidatus Eremiobacteraeota bacterium]
MAAPSADSPEAKRKSYRLVSNIPVEVHVSNIAVPIPAMLGDISEGGCQIVSRVTLARGVTVHFKLPIEDKPSLALTGVIRSVTSNAETKTFLYGVQFEKLRPADRDTIYQFVVDKQRHQLHSRSTATEKAAAQTTTGRASFRAQRSFPIRFVVVGLPISSEAIALDLSRGGTRIAFDEQMRDDRMVELRFTLPSEVLSALKAHPQKRSREFSELRITAKIIPGVERVKNKFVYRLIFQNPTQAFQDEIDRYVHAAQLTELKKRRNT